MWIQALLTAAAVVLALVVGVAAAVWILRKLGLYTPAPTEFGIHGERYRAGRKVR